MTDLNAISLRPDFGLSALPASASSPLFSLYGALVRQFVSENVLPPRVQTPFCERFLMHIHERARELLTHPQGGQHLQEPYLCGAALASAHNIAFLGTPSAETSTDGT